MCIVGAVVIACFGSRIQLDNARHCTTFRWNDLTSNHKDTQIQTTQQDTRSSLKQAHLAHSSSPELAKTIKKNLCRNNHVFKAAD